ncbi:MAG TPA: ATP-dependent DNA helicase [Burkholderiales bacterium]|nr:ATP-dependent DNA helicase [Burkholderiales bacterium]
MQDRLAAVFAAEGPLARAIEGYCARTQQIEMAQRVADAILNTESLIVEAGTGTGKTIAYLVPALLSGGKVLLSTGTKTLQDQLFHRDLPAVREALNVPVTAALLKGRANYVCHHHLQRNLQDGRLASREDVRDLQAIARFARQTHSGDKAELAVVAETSPAWHLATSTRENCLGSKCEHYKECFVMQARKEALAADVVVVNHHLFFADVMLKDEGMAELLPACNTIILDEAHQLPETATLFFGETLSTGQLLDLARDMVTEGVAGAADMRELPNIARSVDRAARDLRLAVPLKEARVPGQALHAQKDFSDALDALHKALRSALNVLKLAESRSEGLAKAAERAEELSNRLERWIDDDYIDQVRWVETYTHALALHATPLSVAEPFKRQLDGHPRAWIFTSATLAVNKNFGHYQAQLGLDDAQCASWDSPFDYAANGLIYLPRELPEPNSAEHTQAVVERALPVLRASGGRAFLLFTTLRAMRQAHALLSERFEAEGLKFPLLMQGEGTRTELLDRFRHLGNAVLLASASFWEGVDVRGDALSLVVIDKLPFAPPDDPVMQARLESLRKQGGNPFMDYQLPQAAIALKQGAGRLIRDERDRGVLMICDPRLASKPYGKTLVASLPPMRRTRDLAAVEAFYARETSTI